MIEMDIFVFKVSLIFFIGSFVWLWYIQIKHLAATKTLEEQVKEILKDEEQATKPK